MTEVAPTETSTRRWLTVAAGVIGVAMSLFHLHAIAIEPPETFLFRAAHLAFAITLVFLLYPLVRRDANALPRWWDFATLGLALACCLYVIVLYKPYLFERDPFIDAPTLRDTIFAVLTVVMVLEATRRILGWSLPLTAVAFLAYAFLFTNIEFARYVNQIYLTTEGIFGQTLGVSAGYVLIFVLFGSFMERAGTGQLFMDFALSLTGHTAGGPGKVAVVSSSLFGTISGSAVANVMVDGPITIPLMKRTGFRAHFGAAVEAVASTGGQLMPPIMGAAAFVMAEFLNVPYLQIVIWAIVPALLYYVACFAAVHFHSKRVGLLGLPRHECPRLGAVMRERGHLFVPLIIILAVMFTGSSAPLAALAATASCVPLIYLRGPAIAVPLAAGIAVALVLATRGGTFELSGPAVVWGSAAMAFGSVLMAAASAAARRRFVRNTGHVVAALIDGAKNALSVALACASAGIVIGVIALTGIAQDFTQILVGLAGSTLWLALLLTAIAGIVLGMGMPTTPAYILMVSLLVPALAKLGIIVPAAHMFAFYFAILSAITPPVALAVFAAASLAKSNVWETGWAAVRIGAAGFIVPFMFAYEPALLLIGSDWIGMVLASASAAIGCIGLAAGLYGYFARRCQWWEQVLLVAGALLLIKPGQITDLIGMGLLGGVWLWQKFGVRAQSEAPAPAQSSGDLASERR